MNDNRIARLTALKNQILRLPEPAFPNSVWAELDVWTAKATPVIRNDWPDFLDDFQRAIAKPDHSKELSIGRLGDPAFNRQQARKEWERDKQDRVNVIKKVVSFLDGLFILAPKTAVPDAVEMISFLCRRFPIFARQLGIRQRQRPPFAIADEYDVQYLLLALLRLHFDDVRPEEWIPSYAGGSSRMDFLIKQEKIVVEAKKTRDTLRRDSEIGDELIVDIERYAQSSDCETLVCFVYDPDNRIKNPAGLESDLTGSRENIEVVVIIAPK
jgi:hypothetical protein